MTDLAVEYRPKKLKHVIGQDAVVESLRGLKDDPPHAYLFHGSSGVGKTTIARIVATEMLGCPEDMIVEVDGATYSKVDDMRTLTGNSMYAPIGSDVRVIIIDECHALSHNAWQALLKSIEEPRDDWYFMFCTTHLAKVPKTVKTRCHAYALLDVHYDDLYDRLQEIADSEGFEELSDEVIAVCAREADGSVRQAITNLSACRDVRDVDQAYTLLQEEAHRPEVIDLCKLLLRPSSVVGKSGGPPTAFNHALKLIKEMQDANAEGIRIVICVYFSKVLLSGNADVDYVLAVLDTFSGKTYNPSEKMAPLLADIGATLLGD